MTRLSVTNQKLQHEINAKKFSYASMLCKNAPFPSRVLTLKPIVVAARKKKRYSFFRLCERKTLICRTPCMCVQQKNANSPQTMSSVHWFINGKISKFAFPTCVSNLLSIICVFSLKIGTNDCKIFKLNDGFMSFRMGFQNVPAWKQRKQKWI